MANSAFGNLGREPAQGRAFGPEDREAFLEDEELETLEASLDGEDFSESDEADYEASDESDEADYEAFGESDEAFGESDEAIGDEDVGESEPEHDEAVSTAQYLAQRNAFDRKRRADMRTQQAAQLNLSNQNLARSVQASVNQQLNRIPRAQSVKVDQIRALNGSGVFKMTLANGRTVAVKTDPTLVFRRDFNNLSTRVNRNHTRQAEAIRTHSVAVAGLKKTLATTTALQQKELLKVSKDLTAQFTKQNIEIDKRIGKEVEAQRKLANRQDRQIVQRVERKQRESFGHTLVLASSLPMYAAYGQYATGNKANPFNATNAVLTASTVGWMLSNNVVGHYARKSKTMNTVSKAWPYVSVAGNLLTSYLALRGEAHNDIVSGVEKAFTGAGVAKKATVKLNRLMGDRYYKDVFKNISSPSVVVGVKSTTATEPVLLRASVDGDNLIIDATLNSKDAGATLEVFWMLDTRKPEALITSSST